MILEVNFIGYDEESKGYQIYWPKLWKISVEHDIYINKQQVFKLESIQIEGENLDLSNAQDGSTPQSTAAATPEPKKNESNQDTVSAPVPVPLPPENPPVIPEP